MGEIAGPVQAETYRYCLLQNTDPASSGGGGEVAAFAQSQLPRHKPTNIHASPHP